MPDMPFWIAKGYFLMAVDAADDNTLEAIRNDLRDPSKSVDEVAQRNLNLHEGSIEHLREDWFKPTGWFGQDASQVIREAFIHAINIVKPGPKTTGRRLDCYWVCVRGDEDLNIQAAVSGTPGSVVVIIKTPFPARGPVRAGTIATEEPFRLVFAGREPFSPEFRAFG
jgi:hypothetical protein